MTAGMPGVIGCIDGSHIPSEDQEENAELYRCRKGYFSINMQDICDAHLKFMNIIASWPGSVHDSRIFENSHVCHILEQGNHPGYLLRHSGYPCRSYLLTPVQGPTTDKERRYNTAHTKTRNVIERAFGVLKNALLASAYPPEIGETDESHEHPDAQEVHANIANGAFYVRNNVIHRWF
nr:putative nuclease HARBI1 [Penaeus vannamei]